MIAHVGPKNVHVRMLRVGQCFETRCSHTEPTQLWLGRLRLQQLLELGDAHVLVNRVRSTHAHLQKMRNFGLLGTLREGALIEGIAGKIGRYNE